MSYQRLYLFFAWFYSFTKVVLLLFIVGLILHFFVISGSVVRGNSMVPTYTDRQFLLVDKLSYRWRPPQRGEIVSFYFPGGENRPFIKRIIGLPGEVITIKDKKVYINDKLLEEPYLNEDITLPDVTYAINENEYYVMGDNRSASLDSRVWGGLPQNYLIGRILSK